jgi:hypothetical protein
MPIEAERQQEPQARQIAEPRRDGRHLLGPRSALDQAGMLLRLARDLPGFLNNPITIEQAVATLKRRLEARQARLVTMADSVIFGHPRSPYLKLLRAAGCEAGDFSTLAAREGVEGALARLAELGVYLSFDEFKGRSEAVRGSQRFAFTAEDFDNPRVIHHFEVPSGGSRGSVIALKTGLDYLADRAVDDLVALQAHGLAEADHAIWRTRPIRILLHAKMGRVPVAWFYTMEPLPPKLFLGASYLAGIARLAGCSLPWPRFGDIRRPELMAGWLVDRLRSNRPICLAARGSSAVRIAEIVREMGGSLEGVWFILAGEPCTSTKRKVIEASGARVVVRYSVMEAGSIGYGCVDPQAADDVHMLSDCYALVNRTRAVGEPSVSVDAFLLTSLLLSGPKVLLNVESGDYGLIERRACDCQLGALGLQDHISEIRSFEKLTGEGMTFVKSQLVHVLEEALPKRFGGSSADYQVLEEADGNGVIGLYLLASPRLGPLDEVQLKQSFLAELGRGSVLEAYMASVWERAGTIQIKRQEPVATKAGKVFPFQLLKNTGP